MPPGDWYDFFFLGKFISKKFTSIDDHLTIGVAPSIGSKRNQTSLGVPSVPSFPSFPSGLHWFQYPSQPSRSYGWWSERPAPRSPHQRPRHSFGSRRPPHLGTSAEHAARAESAERAVRPGRSECPWDSQVQLRLRFSHDLQEPSGGSHACSPIIFPNFFGSSNAFCTSATQFPAPAAKIHLTLQRTGCFTSPRAAQQCFRPPPLFLQFLQIPFSGKVHSLSAVGLAVTASLNCLPFQRWIFINLRPTRMVFNQRRIAASSLNRSTGQKSHIDPETFHDCFSGSLLSDLSASRDS